MSSTPSKKSILINLAVAICIAALVLAVVVLPAEYNIDPTGLGKLMGLTELAAEPEDDHSDDHALENVSLEGTPVSFLHDSTAKSEVIEIHLKSSDEVEYKALLNKGEPMLYSWSVITEGEVYYDFHGEPSHPEEFEEGFFQSYEVGDGVVAAQGSFVAPFEGRHGWYWLNISEGDITIRLQAQGYYAELVEVYRSNQLTGPYEPEEEHDHEEGADHQH